MLWRARRSRAEGAARPAGLSAVLTCARAASRGAGDGGGGGARGGGRRRGGVPHLLQRGTGASAPPRRWAAPPRSPGPCPPAAGGRRPPLPASRPGGPRGAWPSPAALRGARRAPRLALAGPGAAPGRWREGGRGGRSRWRCWAGGEPMAGVGERRVPSGSCSAWGGPGVPLARCRRHCGVSCPRKSPCCGCGKEPSVKPYLAPSGKGSESCVLRTF